MGKMRLDLDTADRILAGQVDPADAPPGFRAVVTLILTVRTPEAPVRIPTIAASRPSAPLRSRRRTMLATAPFRPQLSILAAAVVLGGASGAAYAAGLPAAASSTAQHVLQSLGVTPGAKTHGGTPAGTHGATVSTLARTTTAAGSEKGAQIAATASTVSSHARGKDAHSGGPRGGDAGEKHHGHGATISALAHSTSGTAGAKGATISAAASGGKSHAGEHGHNGRSRESHGNGGGHGHSGGHGGS